MVFEFRGGLLAYDRVLGVETTIGSGKVPHRHLPQRSGLRPLGFRKRLDIYYNPCSSGKVEDETGLRVLPFVEKGNPPPLLFFLRLGSSRKHSRRFVEGTGEGVLPPGGAGVQ